MIGLGQMFGEEDAFLERAYSSSVTCKSNTGDVYRIKSDDFFKKMKVNKESWKTIELMVLAK